MSKVRIVDIGEGDSEYKIREQYIGLTGTFEQDRLHNNGFMGGDFTFTDENHPAETNPLYFWQVKVEPVNETIDQFMEFAKEVFVKDDSKKIRMDLLLPGFLEEVGAVLTHGANKYGAGNWKHGEKKRYVAAIFRHYLDILQHVQNEEDGIEDDLEFDTETGFTHYALLTCSAMFLWWLSDGTYNTTCECKHCNKE